MELDPEVHSHPHHSGHRWIDITLALSALFVSVTSIIISLQNEANMRRLVTANSWPYISVIHGDFLNGRRIIHFDVRNAGIGPATLEKLVVTYDGQPMSSGRALMERCCGKMPGIDTLPISINAVSNQVLSPREERSFLEIERTDANAATWDQVDAARVKIDMSACYSSVFGEHWTTNMLKPKPVPVKSCDELPGTAYDANILEEKPPGA